MHLGNCDAQLFVIYDMLYAKLEKDLSVMKQTESHHLSKKIDGRGKLLWDKQLTSEHLISHVFPVVRLPSPHWFLFSRAAVPLKALVPFLASKFSTSAAFISERRQQITDSLPVF